MRHSDNWRCKFLVDLLDNEQRLRFVITTWLIRYCNNSLVSTVRCMPEVCKCKLPLQHFWWQVRENAFPRSRNWVQRRSIYEDMQVHSQKDAHLPCWEPSSVLTCIGLEHVQQKAHNHLHNCHLLVFIYAKQFSTIPILATKIKTRMSGLGKCFLCVAIRHGTGMYTPSVF